MLLNRSTASPARPKRLTPDQFQVGREFVVFDSQLKGLIGHFTVTQSPHSARFNPSDPSTTPIICDKDENGATERIQMLSIGYGFALELDQQEYIAGLMEARKLFNRYEVVDASDYLFFVTPTINLAS